MKTPNARKAAKQTAVAKQRAPRQAAFSVKRRGATTLATTHALVNSHMDVLQAVVTHVRLTALDGVVAILKNHSTVRPFPDPVTPAMSLLKDFKLAPLGVETMVPDLSALRRALGKSGVVQAANARAARTVQDLVDLVQ